VSATIIPTGDPNLPICFMVAPSPLRWTISQKTTRGATDDLVRVRFQYPSNKKRPIKLQLTCRNPRIVVASEPRTDQLRAMFKYTTNEHQPIQLLLVHCRYTWDHSRAKHKGTTQNPETTPHAHALQGGGLKQKGARRHKKPPSQPRDTTNSPSIVRLEGTTSTTKCLSLLVQQGGGKANTQRRIQYAVPGLYQGEAPKAPHGPPYEWVDPISIGIHCDPQENFYCGVHVLNVLANNQAITGSELIRILAEELPQIPDEEHHHDSMGNFTTTELNRFIYYYTETPTALMPLFSTGLPSWQRLNDLPNPSREKILQHLPQGCTTLVINSPGHYFCRVNCQGTWYEVDSIPYGRHGRIRKTTEEDWATTKGNYNCLVALDAWEHQLTGERTPRQYVQELPNYLDKESMLAVQPIQRLALAPHRLNKPADQKSHEKRTGPNKRQRRHARAPSAMLDLTNSPTSRRPLEQQSPTSSPPHKQQKRSDRNNPLTNTLPPAPLSIKHKAAPTTTRRPSAVHNSAPTPPNDLSDSHVKKKLTLTTRAEQPKHTDHYPARLPPNSTHPTTLNLNGLPGVTCTSQPPAQELTSLAKFVPPDSVGLYCEPQESAFCGAHALNAYLNTHTVTARQINQVLRDPRLPEPTGTDHEIRPDGYWHITQLNMYLYFSTLDDVVLTPLLEVVPQIRYTKTEILGQYAPPGCTALIIHANAHYKCWKRSPVTLQWYELDSLSCLNPNYPCAKLLADSDWSTQKGTFYSAIRADAWTTGHIGLFCPQNMRTFLPINRQEWNFAEPQSIEILEGPLLIREAQNWATPKIGPAPARSTGEKHHTPLIPEAPLRPSIPTHPPAVLQQHACVRPPARPPEQGLPAPDSLTADATTDPCHTSTEQYHTSSTSLPPTEPLIRVTVPQEGPETSRGTSRNQRLLKAMVMTTPRHTPHVRAQTKLTRKPATQAQQLSTGPAIRKNTSHLMNKTRRMVTPKINTFFTSLGPNHKGEPNPDGRATHKAPAAQVPPMPLPKLLERPPNLMATATPPDAVPTGTIASSLDKLKSPTGSTQPLDAPAEPRKRGKEGKSPTVVCQPKRACQQDHASDQARQGT
jgi:hypothetical protein